MGWGLLVLFFWFVCFYFYRLNNIKIVNIYGICNKNYFIMIGILKFYIRLVFFFFKNMLLKIIEILIKIFIIMLKYLVVEL